MLTSVLQGFGGSPIVLQAAQLAFIADSSTTTSRSFYFGLALLTPLIGSPIAVFVSLSKVGEGANQGHLAPFIFAAIGCWVAYHLYLTFILREARFVDGSFDRDIDQESHAIPVEATTPLPDVDATWTTRNLLKSILDPIKFIFRDRTLRWLAPVTFMISISRSLSGLVTIHSLKALKVEISDVCSLDTLLTVELY